MKAAHDPAATAAALLVDADNVTAAAVEHALAHLERQGWRVTLRRAYGGHEKLAGMKECLLRHGLRAFVNQGKGTTDALLVLDAMDLLHVGDLPGVVAIASSDADFAPLALRLREAGRWVLCFAHEGKSADAELSRCYDELLYVDGAAAAPSPESAPAPTSNRAPARKRRQPAESSAPAPARAPAEDPLRDLLAGVDGLHEGRAVELNDVVKRLRDAGLLGKRASGPAFLKKNAPYLELTPADQPNKVRWKERRR